MKIIECPRDAMQGMHQYIPVNKKAAYINSLLNVGFDTIDFGSFVSPKAIPQLKDTAEVLEKLDVTNTKTKLLAIVGNIKGGEIASQFEQITYLGYPHSVSNSFLKININSSIEKSRITIDKLLNSCLKCNQELVVYLSMAFGNHYGDEWNYEIIYHSVEKMRQMGIKIISLSDTVGVSTPEKIENIFKNIIPEFSDLEIGFHLHTTSDTWKAKIEKAWVNGCRRFDSVINGLGGCPMAKHELVGNLNTSDLLWFLNKNNIKHSINEQAFIKASKLSNETFNFNELI
ncbi:MAG: hydroxymethylglutaryl-CoA lyase [Chlorobi bacterium]|nr:hydroxymethylglutaryl-CoA lyase [Chlorobiota bacterium]